MLVFALWTRETDGGRRRFEEVKRDIFLRRRVIGLHPTHLDVDGVGW